MTLEVECLVCAHVYLEHDTFIEECANCGNTDAEQTIYLQEEVTE
jgi:hypothetical protein